MTSRSPSKTPLNCKCRHGSREVLDDLPREYGSLDAAAERLGCSVHTVRRMISRGELAGYRVGKRLLRVDLAEIDAVVRRIPTAGGGAV